MGSLKKIPTEKEKKKKRKTNKGLHATTCQICTSTGLPHPMCEEYRGLVTNYPNLFGDFWMCSQWLRWGTNVKLSRLDIDWFKEE